MVGRIIYRQERGGRPPCRERLCGLPVLSLTLCEPPGSPAKKLDKRLEKLERIFRKAEVSRVILPEQFPHAGKLRWIHPVSTVTFYRAVSDLLVFRLLEKRGLPPHVSCVALTAQRPGPELFHTACLLCRSVRAVKIEIPGAGGEEMARELQRQFGVPVVPPVTPADVTLSFCERAGDLRLWEGKLELSGLRLTTKGADLPLETEQQVLALLWERGSLKREDLQVTDGL